MNATHLPARVLLSSLCFAVIAASGAYARPPEGGYFGFGLGYGIVSGERGVPLKTKAGVTLQIPTNLYDEAVRTEYGEGMSFELRFGWLIGPIAPEISLFGHGSFDFENGAGYPMLQVRFHPLMLVDSMAESKIDGSVYVGAGYTMGGYHHEGSDDGKGWEGWVFDFGLSASYELSKRVHLALDVKFLLPQYSSWMFDWDDDINFEPASTPSMMVIAPSLQIQAFF